MDILTKIVVYHINFNACAILLRFGLFIYLLIIPGQIKNINLLKSIDKVIFSTPTSFLDNSFQNRGENFVFVP